jgi:transposase-like protein
MGGHREILGKQVTSAEDGVGWASSADLCVCGLSAVRLVTADAHAGLVAAIGATVSGATWKTLPHALRGELDVDHPEVQPALGAGVAAFGP